MGHRTVKRVPLDFSWPLRQRWKGYTDRPERSFPDCPDCAGDGLSVAAQAIRDTFVVPGLPQLSWRDKLTQDEVDFLWRNGRLMSDDGGRRVRPERPPTAAQVNAADSPFGRDLHGVAQFMLTERRCARLGLEFECSRCDAHGNLASAAEREQADRWTPTEPPQGPGWQLWETTSEGSPVSPVFASADELAAWCETGATVFAQQRMSAAQWLASFADDQLELRSMLTVARS